MEKPKVLFMGIMVVVLMFLSFSLPRAYGFFDQTTQQDLAVISIGDFTFEDSMAWDPEKDYEIGDRFTYNGLLWEIRADGDYSLPPEGDVLQPFGPYQEVTDLYRPYNTYFEGDIVIHEGIEYQALYGGMSGQTPGTVVGWQALSDEWQPFNVYQGGDVVMYEGNTFEANYYTQGDQPDENVGQWAQWRLIQSVITPGDTTHLFDDNVLNATITFDGIVIVEDGVINQTNADLLGIDVEKQSAGNVYWVFSSGNNRIRIRTNNTIQYQQSLSFETITFDLP